MNIISGYNEELLVRVAWEYFINETSQADIARYFKVSRPTVSRLVKRAKELGLVQISIHSEFGLCIELEQEFRRRFKLKAIHIVPSGITQESGYDSVARIAAEFLNEQVPNLTRIAVGWGRTISHIAHFARKNEEVARAGKLEIVEMVGNFQSTSTSLHSLRLATSLAYVYGASASVLSAPALAQDHDMYKTLMSHVQIETVLGKARKADLAVASLGSADSKSTLYSLGLMTDEELKAIQDLGAAGEILGRFFDEKGRSIQTSLDGRLIGLTLEDLKNIPHVMVVSSGLHKVKAIRAALDGQILNHLVTDDQTAQEILNIS